MTKGEERLKKCMDAGTKALDEAVSECKPKHNPTDNLRPQTAPPFSKENQPSREAKSAGQKRYQALKSIKNDLFEEMIGHKIPENMIEKIKEKVEQGDVKEALDLLKIITPKEMDINNPDGNLTPQITINTNLKKQGE